ncbi:MAG: 50S ribosomal protein L29 [Halobacteriovorax sp.]|nr:50S ribosomal protein L29 [Halobacteriovorax sp.]|tara:strand:- start:207637 stop:207843 length:207 start_codon:yes stop_codon:yes gene_type:complete
MAIETLKYEEVKGWDAKQIDSKVEEIRTELFNIRMQKVASGIDKPHLLKIGKKNIAKLLTAKSASRGK